MKLHVILISLFVLLACTKQSKKAMPNNPSLTNEKTLTYLALGDSYTIGESVAQKESFPYQLVSVLKSKNIVIGSPKIIAKTGWTSDELQSAIKAENINQTFDIVTLLIGVNNQYRGNPKATYRKEFKELLQQAIGFAGGNKKHVFVVSIPDWGVTPFAKGHLKSVQTIASEIDEFNAINKEESLAMQVSYVDITPGSRIAATDVSLIASDGLHPSGKMYGQWAEKLGEVVKVNF